MAVPEVILDMQVLRTSLEAEIGYHRGLTVAFEKGLNEVIIERDSQMSDKVIKECPPVNFL